MKEKEKETAFIEHIETILSCDDNGRKRNFYWLRFVTNKENGKNEERQACFILTREGFIYESGDCTPLWFDDDNPKWDKIFCKLVTGKLEKYIIE